MATEPASDPSASGRRKRVGELAVEKGLITQAQLGDALKAQAEMKKLGLSEKIGTILYKKKMLSRELVQELLRDQALIQRRLGNFEIYERIGSGAMGVVFRARQISMDRIVALKILSPKYSGDPAFIEGFVREARAAGQFNHEHIVAALDVGFSDPYHYFAMEYVEGKNLRQILKDKKRFPEKEALRIVLGVARALEHAWARKIIHRDVKPDNIMLAKDEAVKLLDLGLACAVNAEREEREAEEAAESEKTGEAKKAFGTPLYISPEAAQGQDLDTRADIYSLGCTLYHLLSGKPPFEGRSREVMELHVHSKVPNVRDFAPDITAETARIVERMAARDRDARYANPEELIEDLEAALEGRASKALHKARTGAYPATHKSTTGPRAPIAGKGTTGPRAPVRAQSTTGPRTAVQVRVTTGPADAVRSITNTGKAPPPQASSAGMKIGIAAAVLVVLGGLAFAFTGKSETREAAMPEKKPDPKPAEAPKPHPAEVTKTATQPPKPTLSKEEMAKVAWDDYHKLAQAKPDDFPALLVACGDAVGLAEGTPQAAPATEAQKALKARVQAALDAHFAALAKTAEEKFGAGQYAEALAALAEDAVPANLRVEDWKARLDAAHKPVAERIEAEAAKLLEDARKKAQPGTVAALKSGIEVATKAGEIPAPSGLKAKEEAAAWQAKIEDAQKAEDAAKLAQAEKAKELMSGVRKELDTLLKANRLSAALDLVEKHLGEMAFAAAKDALQKERADLLAIRELRTKTLDALKRRVGERITLHRGKDAFEGTIKDEPKAGSLTLQLAAGPELALTADLLDPRDIEIFATADVAPNAGELFRRKGLLMLAAGDFASAKKNFTSAKDAGLGDAVAPYLLRLEELELGETEVQARTAFAALDALAKAQKWKELAAAGTVFTEKYGATKYAKEKDAEFKALLAQAEEKLLLSNINAKDMRVYFKFSEGKGNTSANAVANGPGVELFNGVGFRALKNGGNALQLNGKDQYAYVKIDVSETAFTVCMWIQTKSADCGIFEIDGAPLGGNGNDRHLFLAGGKLQARVWNNENVGTPDGNLADGAWHHIALTFGGDVGGQRLYVDGVCKVTGKRDKSDFNWQTGATIGFSNDPGNKYFAGQIAGVMLFDRALSDKEFKALAATPPE